MHAAKQFIGMKFEGETDARAVVAPAFAALQVQTHVIEDLRLIVDDGRWHNIIAHYIRRRMEQVRIGSCHQQAQVVKAIEDGTPIIYSEKSARIRTSRRER